jgi:hypothetical protein
MWQIDKSDIALNYHSQLWKSGLFLNTKTEINSLQIKDRILVNIQRNLKFTNQ